MAPEHVYRTSLRWTGDLGDGTREYRGYSRDHTVRFEGKPELLLTSGISPRSDPTRTNPDELVIAALSSCHLLTYLHLCSEQGVVVTGYTDEADGTLSVERGGAGRLTRATLRPKVTVREGSLETATALHAEAHRRCFVANSVNFPVAVEPTVVRAD
jgi:organic hydroperoxide reductase OsmC/OhrA